MFVSLFVFRGWRVGVRGWQNTITSERTWPIWRRDFFFLITPIWAFCTALSFSVNFFFFKNICCVVLHKPQFWEACKWDFWPCYHTENELVWGKLVASSYKQCPQFDSTCFKSCMLLPTPSCVLTFLDLLEIDLSVSQLRVYSVSPSVWDPSKTLLIWWQQYVGLRIVKHILALGRSRSLVLKSSAFFHLIYP